MDSPGILGLLVIGVAFTATGILPRFLLSPTRRYKLPFLITFVVFFSTMLLRTLPKFPLWEAILTSVFVGIIPIVGAIVYVRFFLSQGKEK